LERHLRTCEHPTTYRLPLPGWYSDVKALVHFVRDVPGIGHVAVSRHAQERAEKDRISEHTFANVLMNGKNTPDGQGVVWREASGVRVVIVLRPEPFHGAALVTTMYRIKAQARSR